MNPNSKEAHNNMTAKISLHGQMIMSHLPELKTLKNQSGVPIYASKLPTGYFDRTPGATCEHMAPFVGLTELQCVRRMSELKRAGLVIESSEKFTYISGGKRYSKTIWMAVDNSPK